MKLKIAPAYYLEFPGHSTGRVMQAEPEGVPELKCKETKVAECREQGTERKQLHGERTLEVCGGSQLFST